MHEREHAFLHARPARGREENHRQARGERVLNDTREFFANHRPHAPTEEGEVEQPQRYWPAVNGGNPTHRRLFASGLLASVGQPGRIRLAIAKPQRIGRAERRVVFNKRATIDYHEQTLLDREAHVRAALGTDE